MKPLSIPATFIMLGLQTVIIGVDSDSKNTRLIGACIASLGWVLDIISVLLPYLTNG